MEKKNNLTLSNTSERHLAITNIEPQAVPATYNEITSLSEALNTDAIPILRVAQERGKETALIILTACIGELANKLQVNNAIPPQFAREVANDILLDFGSLTAADFAVIFRNARLGKYGETYNKLTQANIYKWCADYFENKCNHCGEVSRNEAKAIKEATKQVKADLCYTVVDGRIIVDKAKLKQQDDARAEEINRIEKEKENKKRNNGGIK